MTERGQLTDRTSESRGRRIPEYARLAERAPNSSPSTTTRSARGLSTSAMKTSLSRVTYREFIVAAMLTIRGFSDRDVLTICFERFAQGSPNRRT